MAPTVDFETAGAFRPISAASPVVASSDHREF
jgi:hypothetical protein